MQIAALGECMIELSGAPLRKTYGGDTLNTAVYLARLLAGGAHAVHYLTALGQDNLSDELLAAWQAEGINTARVVRLAARQPGLYLVETDAAGERRFHYWRNDSAARAWFASGIDFATLLAGLDAVYLSGITLALFPHSERTHLIAALRAFKAAGGVIWFDNNYRPALWSPAAAREAYPQLYALADVALLTEDDDIAVFGPADADTMLQRALAAGAAEVVIKRGSLPCLIANAQQRHEVAPAAVSRVVDTCAAGDSFAAGYLAARLHGLALPAAAAQGHLLAGTVIQHPGAIMPQAAMPALP
ncbi:2-dehydro-3-deoxygluconokinase [Andreprevotia lacus DSM 23236]|jgi:2-dehydro-3-deoxygluconokinase|uniref:2-dehydro-3-deoxygluconokinase n=1 Tax=Andreprevotia lacus DSM 23236 TaxID=1121001 RepID=A0A1W1XWK5_9NEIS|nr:sugar kinase [Andreprevotia lacus]SMC27911.1 2-dehydro-3-deoxygluconokinase [Andreprevotia lacus DSM 23236]